MSAVPVFSSRLQWSAPLNPITELLARKRDANERIFDLTESNPTHAGIQYPAAEIGRALGDERVLRYDPNPFGSRQAREAVAACYSAQIAPERILLTASTSEAYAYLFKLLADPGDEILAPRPSYPLFEYLAQLESVRIVQYPLFYDHGWHFDSDALRTAVTDRTRAIVIVNPNNPTGSYLKRRELKELAAIGRERSLAIISDEVFSDYWMEEDPRRVSTLASIEDVLAFSLSGLSKIVGLPQMKLGWMVVSGPAAGREAALSRLELIADTYLSVGAPVQAALPALLAMRSTVQQQIRSRLAANLAALRGAVTPCEARVLEVEGGWYATLQMPRVQTEEEWVTGLLERHSVFVQPGYFYDFESEPFLILSLLTEPAIFAEGVDRLAAYAATVTRP
jgi:alanine-synthesizing transaminase